MFKQFSYQILVLLLAFGLCVQDSYAQPGVPKAASQEESAVEEETTEEGGIPYNNLEKVDELYGYLKTFVTLVSHPDLLLIVGGAAAIFQGINGFVRPTFMRAITDYIRHRRLVPSVEELEEIIKQNEKYTVENERFAVTVDALSEKLSKHVQEMPPYIQNELKNAANYQQMAKLLEDPFIQSRIRSHNVNDNWLDTFLKLRSQEKALAHALIEKVHQDSQKVTDFSTEVIDMASRWIEEEMAFHTKINLIISSRLDQAPGKYHAVEVGVSHDDANSAQTMTAKMRGVTRHCRGLLTSLNRAKTVRKRRAIKVGILSPMGYVAGGLVGFGMMKTGQKMFESRYDTNLEDYIAAKKAKDKEQQDTTLAERIADENAKKERARDHAEKLKDAREKGNDDISKLYGTLRRRMRLELPKLAVAISKDNTAVTSEQYSSFMEDDEQALALLDEALGNALSSHTDGVSSLQNILDEPGKKLVPFLHDFVEEFMRVIYRKRTSISFDRLDSDQMYFITKRLFSDIRANLDAVAAMTSLANSTKRFTDWTINYFSPKSKEPRKSGLSEEHPN